MKKNEVFALGSYISFLLFILIIVTSFCGCDGGWSVGGLDIPEKS